MRQKYDLFDKQLLVMRTIAWGIVALVILMLAFQTSLLFAPFERILDAKAEIAAGEAKGMRLIPDLENRTRELDKQIKTLTTQSIENRLAALEKALRVTDLKPEELVSIQEAIAAIQGEIKRLENNVFVDPERVVEFRTLQQQYTMLQSGLERKSDADDVSRDIASLRSLLYVTLGVAGILVSMLGGSWIVALRRQIKTAAQEPPKKVGETEEGA